MNRTAIVFGVSAAAALAAGCGGGGGGSTTPTRVAPPPQQQTMEEVIVTGGTISVAPDSTTNDPTSGSDKARLGIAGIGRSFSLTTPVNESLDIGLTGSAPGARGTVKVRVAVTGSSSGSAAADLALSGLLPRAGNLIDNGTWLETVGDGFARITLAGAVVSDTTLVVEREAENGTKSTAAVTVKIGPRGPANPTFPVTTAFSGVLRTVDLYSSTNPIFGLPAISGSGDRLSVICYDSVFSSSPGPQPGAPVAACVAPGIERRQKRLQFDSVTSAKTQGETAVLGNDSSYWRDTEIASLYNVLAIAQAGGAGVTVSISFDRGASFPASFTLGSGTDWTRLVAIDMGDDYTTGVLFWNTTQAGLELVLVEGRPTSFDANNSPNAFAFGAPQVLLSKSQSLTPLVSDVHYTPCGDLFIATGYTEFGLLPNFMREMRMTVESFRRYAGTTTIEGPTTVDVETEIVPSDPSIAVVGCGPTAQVFVAYESRDGAKIRKSADGGATFGASTTVGTSSAHAPRVFARPGTGGATVVDCFYLDFGPAALGDDLNLLRVGGDLASNRSIHTLVQAKLVNGTNGQEVESVGWFGFDACELNGDLWVAVHEQLQGAYAPFGGRGVFNATASSAGVGAAPPPTILYDGMTQPVPAFDRGATNKLRILQID